MRIFRKEKNRYEREQKQPAPMGIISAFGDDIGEVEDGILKSRLRNCVSSRIFFILLHGSSACLCRGHARSNIWWTAETIGGDTVPRMCILAGIRFSAVCLEARLDGGFSKRYQLVLETIDSLSLTNFKSPIDDLAYETFAIGNSRVEHRCETSRNVALDREGSVALGGITIIRLKR